MFKCKAISNWATPVACVFLMSHQVAAEEVISDAIGPGESDSKFVLGAVIGSFENPYADEGTKGYIVPTFEWRGERLFVDDGHLGLTLFRRHGFSGGLVLTGTSSFLSDEDDYEDNDRLAGLEERDPTVDGGVYMMHRSDLGQFKLTVIDELTGKHDGQSADLNYTFDLKAYNWSINPYIGVSWSSRDSVDYFYGVNESESSSLRAAYKGKSSTNAYVGVQGRYEITDHIEATIQASYTRFGSGLTDSSIVDEDGSFVSGIGVIYNF